VSVVLTGTLFAESIAERIQRCTVNVQADNAQGSGTIIVRKIDGNDVAFILSAHHVVDGLREVRTVIKNGSEKKVVTYKDAHVLQEKIENGLTVGEIRVRCKVLCVSNVHDLAVLQVMWNGVYRDGVEFDLSGAPPAVGLGVFHAGSPGGKDIGAGSVTSGIVSALARSIDMGEGSQPYDQTTAPSLPGSSGGAIVNSSNGLYLGTLTLGLGNSSGFNWIVPIRRTLTWADEAGIRYIFDPKAKPLTNQTLSEVKIEGADVKVDAAVPAAPRVGEDVLTVTRAILGG
jgi:serine protease Do